MPKKPTSKPKGKGLKGKVGPVPIWALLGGVVIVVGYLYYRNRQNSGSSSTAGTLNQTTIPSGVITPTTGTTTSDNGTPTDQGSGDNSVTFPTDYATETDLANAVSGINDSTSQAIAAITFPKPSINITVPQSSVHSSTTASKTAAKKAVASTPIKYYTRKTQVPLKAHQTLHFTPKKGYYAA